ncbi:MAG TPA: DUF6265 family protein [Xanthomonadales bacterium]|nr:DUF6265 family protein [Xanthomonadales bacterium]
MIRISAMLLLSTSLQAAAISSGPDFQWLRGHWCSGQEGDRIEELWLRPASGEMIGINRTTLSGIMVAFEYLRIVHQDGVTTYVAQPGGSSPTLFPLAGHGDSWVAFENPDHDFPQRIEYHRDGENMQAEISGPGEGGEVMTLSFHLALCEERQ